MHSKDTQATDWSERPLFRQGQQLTAHRLNRIHDHQAERMRHALLGVAGPGVVYGFRIGFDKQGICDNEIGKMYINCGLAIDGYGRQLFWPGGWVGIDVLAEKPDAAGDYRLSVHYAERRTDAGRQAGCPVDEAEWVEEGVVFTLRKGCQEQAGSCPEACAIGLQSQEATNRGEEQAQLEKGDKKEHITKHKGACLTQQDYICQRSGSVVGAIPEQDHLSKLCHTPDPLCDVARDDWLYDANGGEALACLTIEDQSSNDDRKRGCDPHWGFADQPERVCGYRRHLHRNSLLFELINRCHLDHGRVADLSFKDWLKNSFAQPVAWQAFVTAINQGLRIYFNKPILATTLHRASIFVNAIVQDRDTYFQDLWRLPIEKMHPLDAIDEPDGEQYLHGVHLEFNKKWISGQMESELSRFNFGAVIELTVRSAMLRDVCGNMLDGRPLDFPEDLPGQAMPGGDFVAAFCVASRPLGNTPKGTSGS